MSSIDRKVPLKAAPPPPPQPLPATTNDNSCSETAQAVGSFAIGLICLIATLYFHDQNLYITVAFAIGCASSVIFAFYLAWNSGSVAAPPPPQRQKSLPTPPESPKETPPPPPPPPPKRVVCNESKIIIEPVPPFQYEGSLHELIDKAIASKAIGVPFQNSLRAFSEERINERNEKWQNPLHHALAIRAPIAIINALLRDSRVTATTIIDSSDHTALYYAVEYAVEKGVTSEYVEIASEVRARSRKLDEGAQTLLQKKYDAEPKKYQKMAYLLGLQSAVDAQANISE